MKVDSLDYSMHLDDCVAHIITLKGNEVSEKMSARCQDSCKQVGQPFEVWDAFDGTSGEIFYPDHAIGKDQYKWLKQMNDRLTISEIATIFSHFSLWCHSVTIDRPIVILEHDAIMVKPYWSHNAWNQIEYLGNLTQYQEQRWADFPVHSAATKNWKFLCRAHAYAIDPAVARQLISHVIRFGLSAPADMLIRADIFPITQRGFYAFDMPGETTIKDRKDHWDEDAREIFTSFT
jgi:GR25 family glycosyltransferase involved in LPS biosynthesis